MLVFFFVLLVCDWFQILFILSFFLKIWSEMFGIKKLWKNASMSSGKLNFSSLKIWKAFKRIRSENNQLNLFTWVRQSQYFFIALLKLSFWEAFVSFNCYGENPTKIQQNFYKIILLQIKKNITIVIIKQCQIWQKF
jgi:hypothetical protein